MLSMQRTSFRDMACSLARSLDVAGEWWTPLIVRDIWMGRTRFDEIQENLGLSRKLLADRLDTLVRERVVVRKRYQTRPVRHEYLLTEKGEELMVVLLALLNWGDKWTAKQAGPPMLIRHKCSSHAVEAQVTCSECGEPLKADEVLLQPGPGFRLGRGTELPPERHPFYDHVVEAAKGRQRAKPAAR
jgi:DNA-binding HxlR family transcriptional regulator